MKRRNAPSLSKILFVLVTIIFIACGLYYGVDKLRSLFLSERVEASAPVDLDTARALEAEGKIEEARALILPIATRSKDAKIAPAALMYLAELDLKAGNRVDALTHIKSAAYDFPASPDQPRAAAKYAKMLEEDGKIPDALSVYEEIRKNAPPELRTPALCGFGRQAERDGKLIEARALFQEAVTSAPWDTPEWTEAVEALGRANVALIFSPTPTPDSKQYVIQKGDSITSIGNKLNTTQGLLMRANNLPDEHTLRVGQSMKWTPKDFRIVIERSTCRLFLLDSNGIFKRYTVGLGKEGHETALGLFKIGNKEKDPTWHKPGEGPIPPGDLRNELGTRWMPWIPVQEGLPKDLGIHGTIEPPTVGHYSSHGCARMLKEDVEELWDLVVRSTPVQVVEKVEPQSLNTLALAQS
jgi:lipoprotein-anchoring transpeptidase ErfK/SrfK